MEIVDQTKFLLGIVFAVIGVAILIVSRSERGFGQRRQLGALLMFGAAIFVAIGLGWRDL